jgi:hypothetical protein
MASWRSRSRTQRTAWVVVIVAVLLCAVVSQVDDDAASSLRTTDFVSDVQLDQALAARQAQLVTQAWLEYGSLVVAGGTVAIALLVQRHHGQGGRLRIDRIDPLADSADCHSRPEPECVRLDLRRGAGGSVAQDRATQL